MTLKFLLSSIMIFILLFCNCQTQEEYLYSDILNKGYNILKNLGEKSHIDSQISSLWRNITWAHSSPGLIGMNPSMLMLLLSIHGSRGLTTISRCLIHSGHEVSKYTCQFWMHVISDISENREIPDIQIRKVYDYLYAIESQYEHVFLPSNKAIPETFVATDDLYNSIQDSCSNPSACFFRRIARNHSMLNGTPLTSTGYSNSGEIYFAYLIITFNLLKGYAAEIYRYHDISNMPDEDRRIELIQARFLMHTHTIATLAFYALENQNRAIQLDWSLEDDTTESHIQLEWFVGQILVNEGNLNSEGDCWGTCHSYKESIKFYNNSKVPSHGRDVCHGTMSQCHDENEPRFCPAKENSTRRYGGTFGSRKPFTYPSTCRQHNFDLWIEKQYYMESDFLGRLIGIPCDVCTCLCDDHDDPETIRTFSLREVTSDIIENRVITGLRLRKINRTIYIQIREGKLNDNSEVISLHWVPVNTLDETASSNDSFTLSYPSRSFVNLDTISTLDEFVRQHIRKYDPNYNLYTADSYLLTGVKFGTHNGRLNFGIRLTAWNSETRKLSSEKWNNWIFNEDDRNRKRIDLEYPDIPTMIMENVEVEGYNYVQFQPSDNVKDFGQTTVPFLDARDIVTHLPIPLSGAGLYYKGKPGYGGFIGLKLITSDFSRFIVKEVKN